MQTIIITSEKDRRYTASIDGKTLGVLLYPKWYSQYAEIIIGATMYSIKGKGFWQTTREVLRGDEVLYGVKTKWRGTVISRPREPHHFYTLKPQGWFKSGYMLESYKGEEILAVNPVFSWKKFYPGYTVLINGDFDGSESSILLMLIAVHFFRSVQKAAAASASS